MVLEEPLASGPHLARRTEIAMVGASDQSAASRLLAPLTAERAEAAGHPAQAAAAVLRRAPQTVATDQLAKHQGLAALPKPPAARPAALPAVQPAALLVALPAALPGALPAALPAVAAEAEPGASEMLDQGPSQARLEAKSEDLGGREQVVHLPGESFVAAGAVALEKMRTALEQLQSIGHFLVHLA